MFSSRFSLLLALLRGVFSFIFDSAQYSFPPPFPSPAFRRRDSDTRAPFVVPVGHGCRSWFKGGIFQALLLAARALTATI